MTIYKTEAISFGVLFDRVTGKVSQLINPVFEEEFDDVLVNIRPSEYLVKYSKVEYGIDGLLSIEQAQNLINQLEQ